MSLLVRRWPALLLIARLALLATAAVSDEPARPQPDTRTLMNLQARFASGRSARVTTPRGFRLLESPVISSEGVRAAPEESLRTLIPWSEIERIDARGGSPARGGLVGGIVGAGGGIGLGFIAALADESGGHPLTTILGVTALMAASGAIVGAGVGSLFPGWVKVYPGHLERSSSWGFGRRK